MVGPQHKAQGQGAPFNWMLSRMNDRHAPYSWSTVSSVIFVTSSTLSRIAQLKTQLVLWLVNEAPMSFYINSGWAQVGDAAWVWCLGVGVMLMLCLANGGKPGYLEYTTCVWPNRTLAIKIKKKYFLSPKAPGVIHALSSPQLSSVTPWRGKPLEDLPQFMSLKTT